MRFNTREELLENELKIKRLIKRVAYTVGSVVITGILFTNFTETVSQGHVGVVFNKMKGGVQEEVLPEGLNLVLPLSKITEYPVSVETIKYKLTLPTADTKTIAFPITFDYHNEHSKVTSIYREWRGQKPEILEDGFLRTKMIGVASDITSKYTILELNTNRVEIQAKILKEFTKRVEDKGFVVTSITLGSPEYDNETKNAIQKVVTKQQELKALETDKQKAVLNAEKQKIEAEGNATAKIEEARGEAEAQLVNAKATAEANRKINASLSDKVLKLEEMKARQKHGWVTINGATPLVESK